MAIWCFRDKLLPFHFPFAAPQLMWIRTTGTEGRTFCIFSPSVPVRPAWEQYGIRCGMPTRGSRLGPAESYFIIGIYTNRPWRQMWPIPEPENMITVSSYVVTRMLYLATKYQDSGSDYGTSHQCDLGQVTSSLWVWSSHLSSVVKTCLTDMLCHRTDQIRQCVKVYL